MSQQRCTLCQVERLSSVPRIKYRLSKKTPSKSYGLRATRDTHVLTRMTTITSKMTIIMSRMTKITSRMTIRTSRTRTLTSRMTGLRANRDDNVCYAQLEDENLAIKNIETLQNCQKQATTGHHNKPRVTASLQKPIQANTSHRRASYINQLKPDNYQDKASSKICKILDMVSYKLWKNIEI